MACVHYYRGLLCHTGTLIRAHVWSGYYKHCLSTSAGLVVKRWNFYLFF